MSLWMRGFDSAVGLVYGDRTFDDGCFEVIRFSDLLCTYAILGHISVLVEIYKSLRSRVIIPTDEIHAERGRVRHFIVIFRCSLSWVTHHDSHLSALRCHRTSPSEIWFHTGAYSISEEIYGSSWTCTIIITYWMLTETWTWSSPYGAPEIHPASFALLDTWMPSCLSIWEVILDICAWFSYGFGWPVLHVRR